MTDNGNGNEWLSLKEVDLRDMPSPKARASVWTTLYEEIALRLEQTNGMNALAFEFDSYRIANNGRNQARVHFNKDYCKKYIKTAVRKHPGGATLYVARGKDWYL